MFTQLSELNQEMNRLFDRWGESGRAFLTSTFPAVNVWEEGENLIVEAELPGLELSEIEIYVTGQNQLTIKGERKAFTPEKGTQHRQERGFGNFVRTLTLPFPVDDSKVDAHLENGILKLRLPKHEAAKPRRIAVKAAEQK